MTAQPKFPMTIAGAGGGKKGGGSKGATGGGVEIPNSLRSKQVARVIDLLGEGPIIGLPNGMRDIYFDGVPVANPDSSLNFNSFEIGVALGYPDNPLLAGFAAQQAETSVGLQLKTTGPLTRTIIDPNVDRVRLTVSVPALMTTNKATGDVTGAYVAFYVHVQSNGGGFQYLFQGEISGKTNTRYQRQYVFDLPGSPPWDIRLTRAVADSTTPDLQNDLYWDAYTEIIDARVNYNLSAVCGLTVDSEQFQAIPKRVYHPWGLLLQYPNNYNPITRTYTGVWNGGFAYGGYCNNPAWVLYDLIVNRRYGVGDFITASQVDKWSLYKIAQWCDGLVSDGRGGWEPRFVCNAVISDRQEAFDLIQSIASIFRGFTYWGGGQMVAVADQPGDPVALFTNANVVDGQFTYAGADIRTHHTQAMVSWNDPNNLGERRISIAESDPATVARYGIQRTDLIAIGATSESQALRAGKWLLFTEAHEAETVTFRPGLAAAWARPGDIVQISDVTIAGERRGGLIRSATVTSVTIDAPVTIRAGIPHYLSVILPDGSVQSRQVTNGAGSATVLTVPAGFTVAPLPDAVWVLTSSDLNPTAWRVTAVREVDGDTFELSAVAHHPDKWAVIEQNLALSEPDVSNIAIPAVTNLNAKDYLVALSPISVGVRMLISWQSTAPSFEVAYRPATVGNWTRITTAQTALDVEVFDGPYEIQVTPLNTLGRRGVTAKINYTVIGLSAPPSDPYNFRIQSVQGVAMLQWAPATELDVLIGGSYELRYSPQTVGASWGSSNTVITSIPGTATTVELPYRPGTYLLRARDITGLFSKNAALIISSAPDTLYRPYVRLCEQPAWLGTRENMEVLEPQDWLVIGATGGLWDDQLDPIDAWPTVDMLPPGASGPGPAEGKYTFYNELDMGAVLPVRLTVDMIAFPFVAGGLDFIDARAGNVDDWQDWDNASGDGAGMVTVRLRQTDDDPNDAAAVWTEWQQFISGEYLGRGFQFQAWANAPPGQNMAVEQLCVLADIAAKVDQAADVAWTPSKMTIAYHVKFYSIPAISIAIQQGMTGDTFRLTNKTRESFDLELLNGGTAIAGARTFDWLASGY